MSRTYKDQPDWVKARRTGQMNVHHHYRCEDNGETWQISSYYKEKIVTEPHWHLEKFTHYNPYKLVWKDGLRWVWSSTEEEVKVDYVFGRDRACDLDMKHNSGKGCTFYYDPPEGTKWWYNEVGQAERNLYTRQERTYVRSKMKQAKDDYNANGETDIEPATRRNPSGLWGGGWYW